MKLYIGLLVLLAPLSAIAQNGRYKERFEEDLRQFTTNLYQTLNGSVAVGENMVFSPLSIYQALGMLFDGAKGNTKFEIRRAMGIIRGYNRDDRIQNLMRKMYKSIVKSNDGTTTRIANAMFVQENYAVNSEYEKIMKHNYRALVDAVDFADAERTTDRINVWVANQTENFIQDLITSDMLDGLTRLVLVNAIYFKGNWKNSFKDMTKPLKFTLRNGQNINVVGMQQKATIQHQKTAKMTYLRIPYETLSPREFVPSQTYMVIGISRIAKGDLTLSPQLWTEKNWIRTRAELYMPKFMVTKKYDMKEVMIQMGVRDLFIPGQSDLSGITAVEDLTVSDIVHKGFIQVNEEGTKAAAATGVTLIGRMASTGVPKYIINQPFLFGIYDTKSHAFSFLGKIERPIYEE